MTTRRPDLQPLPAHHAPTDDTDARISALAKRQQGVVSRAQLLEAGLTRHAIEYRVPRRRLRPVVRGVYRASPILAPYAREMAALLVCGVKALLSHLTAAALWEILRSRGRAPVDVTVTHGYRPPDRAIRVHRTRPLASDEVAERHGLPVTSVARTLIDIAGVCEVRELERALSLAERAGMVSPEAILRLLERHPRRHGAPALRSLIGNSTMTRSEAEERFVALVRRVGLRVPEVNVVLHGYEVDCLWRAERVVVEIDGFAFHGSRAAFEQDRRRDGALAAAGYRVLRVTWRQIERTPEALAVSIAQTLVRAASSREVAKTDSR